MEYTVQKLGKLTGISTRTLRYYDEIEILKPARINSSGYRIYGENEVDRLQQILFYKELGVSLNEIKNIIDDPLFNGVDALESHRKNLLEKKAQLDLLIENVSRTIASKNGVINMSNKDKFKGFKEKIVSDNENKYGKEIRGKYGNEAIDKSNAKIKGMSEETYNEVEKLEIQIKEVLALAFETNDPAGELAQKAVELHKKWLSYYLKNYSKETHAGLGQMYVEDERFTAYYDKENRGTAKFLRDAILIFTGSN